MASENTTLIAKAKTNKVMMISSRYLLRMLSMRNPPGHMPIINCTTFAAHL